MKKIYPLGNKISELLEESAGDYYNDVPTVDPVEYKTQKQLPALPKGGYGYTSEDDDPPVIVPKKKRKFIEELPPKDSIDDEIDVEFTDDDFEDEDDDNENKEENDLEEQTEGPAKKSSDPNETGDIDPAAQQQTMQDPNAMGGMDPNAMGGMNPNDPNAMGMGGMNPNAMGGMDPNAMGGMGMGVPTPPKKTAEEIGRVFELKKIYVRLLSIEQHLSFSADELLLKLRDFVSRSIELFETVISNIDEFRDELDEIIVMFYKFLEYVYNLMTRYYKIKEREEKKTKLFTKQPIDKAKEKEIEKAGGYIFRLNGGM